MTCVTVREGDGDRDEATADDEHAPCRILLPLPHDHRPSLERLKPTARCQASEHVFIIPQRLEEWDLKKNRTVGARV